MNVKKYDIVRAKKYSDRTTGEEKTSWQNVGWITLFLKEDGTVSGLCEIPALGQEFQVFLQKPRENNQQFPPSHTSNDVKVDDIDW